MTINLAEPTTDTPTTATPSHLGGRCHALGLGRLRPGWTRAPPDGPAHPGSGPRRSAAASGQRLLCRCPRPGPRLGRRGGLDRPVGWAPADLDHRVLPRRAGSPAGHPRWSLRRGRGPARGRSRLAAGVARGHRRIDPGLPGDAAGVGDRPRCECRHRRRSARQPAPTLTASQRPATSDSASHRNAAGATASTQHPAPDVPFDDSTPRAAGRRRHHWDGAYRGRGGTNPPAAASPGAPRRPQTAPAWNRSRR